VGRFGDVIEQVVELRELPASFAVQLLKKKSPREITEKEIEELLRIRPEKVLHSNPHITLSSNKNGFENHHMFEILKGHPHAISLAAPLL
jgi:hypothetical protein